MAMTALILAMAMVTFAFRYAPLAALERLALPPWAYDWLEFVPAAVLAAMLCQSLLREGSWAAANPYLLAALPTTLVAWRTKSMILTMLTGMAFYALLTHLPG